MLKKLWIQWIIFVFLPILLGTFIYTFYRTDTLLLFSWYRKLGVEQFIASTKSGITSILPQIPNIIKYSLPDALWVFSATYGMLLIWKKKTLWTYIPITIAIISEILQIPHIVLGTFSLLDTVSMIAFYFAAVIIGNKLIL